MGDNVASHPGRVRRERWQEIRGAVQDNVILGVACLVSYLVASDLLTRVHSLSRPDDLLGGMWSVIATVFVMRESYRRSMTAAVSRTVATVASLVLCLLYLAFLPFHPWALAVLVGTSALAVTLARRPGDAITAAITTTVVLVVAAVSPQHAWQQPILRLADTLIGVAVGVAAAWLEWRVKGPASLREPATAPRAGS
jgi:hypothetical protein